MDALLRDPDASRGLFITTTYATGINRLVLDNLHPSARVSGLFMQPSLTEAQARGVYRQLPMSYAGFVRHLADRAPFDVVVVQVSRPDDAGMCSFGPAVEFAGLALSRARRRVAVINARTPFLPGADSVALASFSDSVECDVALPTYKTGEQDPVATAIARHVAQFITDGMTLQTGLGKVPGALLSALGDRRDLKFHSGMLSDGVMELHERGALAPGHAHLACALVGSTLLYDWAAENPCVRLRGCDVTHDPRRLALLDGFVAINSAIEVDLFGQCNLERLAGKSVSGPGGAPDFASAARRSPGGLSIIALPASGGGMSRICACLGEDAVVSVPRSEVDIIVTEHGAADLRGKSVHERAEALIAVAAPDARSALEGAWARLVKRL